MSGLVRLRLTFLAGVAIGLALGAAGVYILVPTARPATVCTSRHVPTLSVVDSTEDPLHWQAAGQWEGGMSEPRLMYILMELDRSGHGYFAVHLLDEALIYAMVDFEVSEANRFEAHLSQDGKDELEVCGRVDRSGDEQIIIETVTPAPSWWPDRAISVYRYGFHSDLLLPGAKPRLGGRVKKR